MGYTQHTIRFEPNTVKSNVFGVLWGLKKNGLSEYTINFIRKALMRLKDCCDLDDPDSVKSCIAEMDVAESYKRNLCYAYDHYLRHVGKALNVIEKGCGLSDPDRVKSFIAGLDTAESYKRNLCYAYTYLTRLEDYTGSNQQPHASSMIKLRHLGNESCTDI